MSKLKKLLIACVLIFLSNCAQAWEKFQNYDAWIDKKTILVNKNKRGGKIVYVWTIWNTESTVNLPGKSVKSLIEIDCNDRFVGSPKLLVYSENNAKGSKIASTYMESTRIEPDTLYNDMHEVFCKGWWKVW